jgi:hypothetical protein
MGPVLTIVIGLVLVVGGLSGQLVFAGSSDSGPLLAVLGAALIVYQFWKRAKHRAQRDLAASPTFSFRSCRHVSGVPISGCAVGYTVGAGGLPSSVPPRELTKGDRCS